MKYFILCAVGFLISLNSFGQSACQISNLSTEDKILINNFWIKFKTSINKEDKTMLSELCSFPFECDYCDEKSIDPDKIKVTKELFNKKYFKVFFVVNLKNKVNSGNIWNTLSPNYGSIDKRCSYRFSYPAVEPTNETPGMQIFIVIEKINGQFKITSTWTVP